MGNAGVKRFLRVFVSSCAPLLPFASLLLLPACSSHTSGSVDISPAILAEVNRIRAIDNHAHPVRYVASGPADREFDALPVDSMEPQSDPLQLRPGNPATLEAWRTLWNYPYNDFAPQHLNEWKDHKARVAKEKGDAYPASILDRLGIDVMLANRVHMGPSVEAPRFRWVPYVDALIFPLDNSQLAQQNSDRRAFFADEDAVRQQYLKESGLDSLPGTLDDYLRRVVTPALERHKQGGAVAEKFEVAYLRPFGFDKVDRESAAKVYAMLVGRASPPNAEYKKLQDFLFRYIASECGRLGMAVHIHTSAGSGAYFDVNGANPLLLEPLFDDPDLRKTKFVMLHGGWPFTREIEALLTKPNAYLDFSLQGLLFSSSTLASTLRESLDYVPEKILFGTDAYPYTDELGWEESAWLSAKRGREALAIALTRMVRDGSIDQNRAFELARMVLRDNARTLYGF
jgi:predicted TIM-barrel fold metal-dependent hydrolase